MSVIHNAVFQPMEPASAEACADLRARLGLPSEAPLILHVGRNWYKNRETVLEVTAKVRETRPDVHLVMVGALTPALADQAARLGLTDALHVLDRVTQEDMPTLYTTAAVLLFPSHYEGFGLPVLEAQMCGTPVVCSDKGGTAGGGDTGKSPFVIQLAIKAESSGKIESHGTSRIASKRQIAAIVSFDKYWIQTLYKSLY